MSRHDLGERPVSCASCRTWIQLCGYIARIECGEAAKHIDLSGELEPPLFECACGFASMRGATRDAVRGHIEMHWDCCGPGSPAHRIVGYGWNRAQDQGRDRGCFPVNVRDRDNLSSGASEIDTREVDSCHTGAVQANAMDVHGLTEGDNHD